MKAIVPLETIKIAGNHADWRGLQGVKIAPKELGFGRILPLVVVGQRNNPFLVVCEGCLILLRPIGGPARLSDFWDLKEVKNLLRRRHLSAICKSCSK